MRNDLDSQQDDDDGVFRVVPISDETNESLESLFNESHQDDSDKGLGQDANPEDLLFPSEHLEHVEHGIVEAMKASGVDPALIYAFEETGLIVSEENQHLISESALAEWNAAVDRYRDMEENQILSLPGSDESIDQEPICWSCRKPISESAKRCPHCEAKVEPEPSPEEATMLMEFFRQMDPAVMQEIGNLIESTESGEEFVNMIMVGPCPTCESENTGDCENDSEVEDPCIGRCFDCGQHFCCDCEELFASAKLAALHECPVWEEMERSLDEEDDDEEDWDPDDENF